MTNCEPSKPSVKSISPDQILVAHGIDQQRDAVLSMAVSSSLTSSSKVKPY